MNMTFIGSGLEVLWREIHQDKGLENDGESPWRRAFCAETSLKWGSGPHRRLGGCRRGPREERVGAKALRQECEGMCAEQLKAHWTGERGQR